MDFLTKIKKSKCYAKINKLEKLIQDSDEYNFSIFNFFIIF